MSASASLITTTVTTTTTSNGNDDGSPLTGRWSDDLCGCCNNCCPSGLGFLAFIPFAGNIVMLTCVPCLVGQIAARASYRPTFFGIHGPPQSTRSNCSQAWLMFFLLVTIPTAYAFVELWVGFLGYFAYVVYGFSGIVYITFLVFIIVFITNFRTFMRQRYNIPENGCCDCCVMTFCFVCALAQMYKHVYAEKSDCSICSDPGPHAGGDANGGMLGGATEKTTFVTATAQPQPVVIATAQPVMAVAQPVVVVAQPQVVTATTM